MQPSQPEGIQPEAPATPDIATPPAVEGEELPVGAQDPERTLEGPDETELRTALAAAANSVEVPPADISRFAPPEVPANPQAMSAAIEAAARRPEAQPVPPVSTEADTNGRETLGSLMEAVKAARAERDAAREASNAADAALDAALDAATAKLDEWFTRETEQPVVAAATEAVTPEPELPQTPPAEVGSEAPGLRVTAAESAAADTAVEAPQPSAEA